jgi:predicted nucleotidyltransferase
VTNIREMRSEYMSEQEQQVALEFVSRLRQRFNGQLLSAILYGSRARGEAEPDSDMDVLVVLSTADAEVRKQVRHLAVDICLECGIYPSTRVWSLAEWRNALNMQTQLYRNVQRDGIDLLRLAPAGG